MKIINKPFVKKHMSEFLASQGTINQNRVKKKHNLEEDLRIAKMA